MTLPWADTKASHCPFSSADPTFSIFARSLRRAHHKWHRERLIRCRKPYAHKAAVRLGETDTFSK